MMSKKQVGKKFREFILPKYGSMGKAAKHYIVTTSHISRICSGEQWPSELMLEQIGLERVTVCIKKPLDRDSQEA